MDRRIRHIATLLTLLFLAIATVVGYVQGAASERIANHEPSVPGEPGQRAPNPFRLFHECRWERGPILSIDGRELAVSEPTDDHRQCRYQREYPTGDLAPHVVGQWSLHYGKTGLEAAYNRELVGEPLPPERIEDVFARRPRVGNTLVSTIDARLQRVAVDALEGRRGGIVAMDPRTGAVLASASLPSYDPNGIASNDRTEADEARCALGLGVERDEDGEPVRGEDGEIVECRNPHSPMVSVAHQARRPPGSAFKVVAAAAALESGEFTPTSPSMPTRQAYTAPGDTRALHNYGGSVCGGNLTHALTVSCNTAFAEVAVRIGAEQFYTTASALGHDRSGGDSFVGCDSSSISDLPETRAGCLPTELHVRDADGETVRRESLETPGFRARAGFGQWVVQSSPFGMALVSATVANGGIVPQPRFADRVIDRRGETVEQVRKGLGAQALSEDSARQLGEMMRRVVTGGTASGAFSGFAVPAAGKTGTADQPSCPPDEEAVFGARCADLPHAWFTAFAPLEDPQIAVAVIVERGGTGGRVAAPVAREVMEEYFRLYPIPASEEGG